MPPDDTRKAKMRRALEIAADAARNPDLGLASTIAEVEFSLSEKVDGAISLAKEVAKMEGPRGETGDNGFDADEEEIIERVLPTVLAAVPTAQDVASLVSPGKDGATGPVGPQGARGEPGLNGISIPGADGKPGRDGKDGSPDTPDEVVAKVNKSKKRIDTERLNLDDIRSGISAALAFRPGAMGGSTGLEKVTGSGFSAQGVTELKFTGATLAKEGNGVRVTIDTPDVSGLVPYTGATGDVNLGTNRIIAHAYRADSSDGARIEASNGTLAALFGAGGGANATFYDGVKLDAHDASRILSTDASKNVTALDTATYPSLAELSYVKGVTSAVQTQLDGKQASGTYVTGATNGTLTLTGTTLGLNLANANTWTGQQTFNSAAAIFGVGTITPKIYPAADGTNAVGIYKADGTTQIMYVDTTNSVVGIKTGGVPASSNVLALQVGAKSYAGATTSMVYIQAVGGGSTEALTVVENSGFTVANIMSIRGSAGNALWGINSAGGTMSGTWTIAGGGSISTSTAGGASFFGVAHVTSTSPGGYRINATSDGNFGLYNVTQNYNPVLCRDDTDGATAIGVSVTSRAFTTAGAKIANFLNNTTEKAYIDLNGGFFGLGIITNRLTTKQQQWEYDASNYANITVGSTGGVTFDAVGSGAAFAFSDAVTATQLTSSGLTAGRVTFAGTAGILTDDADFTFATDTLTATKIVGTTSIKVGTAAGYISSDGSTGATGTFTTVDLKTVTVKDGIITAIV